MIGAGARRWAAMKRKNRPKNTTIAISAYLHKRIKAIALKHGWSVNKASEEVISAGIVTILNP